MRAACRLAKTAAGALHLCLPARSSLCKRVRNPIDSQQSNAVLTAMRLLEDTTQLSVVPTAAAPQTKVVTCTALERVAVRVPECVRHL